MCPGLWQTDDAPRAPNGAGSRSESTPRTSLLSHANLQSKADGDELQELRHAHKLTQKRMAEVLGIGQDSVSRLEQRSDLLISTLRGYVEAMGGRLSLIAEFPNQDPVVLAGLAAIESAKTDG